MARAKSKNRANGGANFGFDATLWAAADKLRGHMEVGHGSHPELVEGSLDTGLPANAVRSDSMLISRQSRADTRRTTRP
jgi:hypothetical protein